MDGFAVLAWLRERGDPTPVIVLTARGDVHDRVRGLDLGADDYLTKPFAFDELLARMHARLRPSSHPAADAGVLEASSLRLDVRTRRIDVDGVEASLSAREFALLETFMRHPGQVLSREQLLAQVWGYDFDPGTNVVDVYVGCLRKKIGARVDTVRGVGYRLRDRDGGCVGGSPNARCQGLRATTSSEPGSAIPNGADPFAPPTPGPGRSTAEISDA